MHKKCVHISRRDFLKGAGAGVFGLTLGADNIWSVVSQTAGDSARSSVIVGRSDDIMDSKDAVNQAVVDKLIDEMIRTYTGKKDVKSAWSEFFSKKDIVGVKANVKMTRTHREVLLHIIRRLKLIGIPDEHIIVFERGRGTYGESGLDKRAEQFGYSDDSISKVITEHATALINAPGTKVHWLSGIGVCLKNWCGAVSNINVRDENASFVIHQNSCEDLGLIPAHPAIRDKLRLNIADALMPLAHGGPQVDPKYLWQNKEILLSADQVAVDAVCLQLIQKKRHEMNKGTWPLNPPPIHVAAAQNKYKLGIADLERIDITRVSV